MSAVSRTTVSSWCPSMYSLLPRNLPLNITGASRTLMINLLEFEAKLRASSLFTSSTSMPPKRSQNSWRTSSMSLFRCANSNVDHQRMLYGGCRQQPLTLNVHAGVLIGNGTVVRKSQIGLRIVVLAVLFVNSFRLLFATISSKNCQLLQTPNNNGL
jgi:hypothetical protein